MIRWEHKDILATHICSQFHETNLTKIRRNLKFDFCQNLINIFEEGVLDPIQIFNNCLKPLDPI